MVEPSVLAVLRQAVKADPENVALRSHLVEVLFRAEEWQQVLEECDEILARDPRDSDALGYAAAAAEAIGSANQAAHYQSLRNSTEPIRSDAPAQSDHCASPTKMREKVLLADVAGMEDVKRRIELAVLNPLRNPEITKAYASRSGVGFSCTGRRGAAKRSSHGR